MREKRGQFYLVAGIVIIGLLIGYATAYNYFVKKPSIRVEDMKEEIKTEIGKILDNSVYLGTETDSAIKQFTDSYADYTGTDKDLYFIFGDATNIKAVKYQTAINEPFEVNDVRVTENGVTTDLGTPATGTVDALVNDGLYRFEIKQGENFYFIISQETGGEKYVTVSD
jgi:hypothetical protein